LYVARIVPAGVKLALTLTHRSPFAITWRNIGFIVVLVV
jgi:hypothetical protein